MAKARKKPRVAPAIEMARVPEMSPTLMRRIIDRARHDATDARLGTQLGRLYLEGKISDVLFRVGTRFAELRHRWRAVHGIRQPSPRSAALGAVSATPPDDDPQRVSAIDAAEAGARSAIMSAHGYRGEALFGAVVRICDHDRAPAGVADLRMLEAGLTALAIDWGMVTGQKSKVS
jgi:hypothetical protein